MLAEALAPAQEGVTILTSSQLREKSGVAKPDDLPDGDAVYTFYRHPAHRLLNIRKGGGHAFHAAHPAGDVRCRFTFTFSHRAQQEHFAIFGGDFHV